MITEIITDIDKLSCRADEFNLMKSGVEVRKVIINLKDTIREHNLKSLTGPQIGSNYRVMVINFDGELRTFCNPIIMKTDKLTLSKETCSSIPGKTFIIPRYGKIDIAYLTPMGEPKTVQLLGVAAEVFQHAIDHLDGILVSDIGLEIDDDFDKAPEDERQEVINAYLESLDIKLNTLKEDIKQDDTLSKLDEAIDFMAGVQTGKVKLIDIKELNGKTMNE